MFKLKMSNYNETLSTLWLVAFAKVLNWMFTSKNLLYFRSYILTLFFIIYTFSWVCFPKSFQSAFLLLQISKRLSLGDGGRIFKRRGDDAAFTSIRQRKRRQKRKENEFLAHLFIVVYFYTSPILNNEP